MLKYYTIILYNTLITFHWLTLFYFILFFISIILLFSATVVLIFDITYRPDSPQYPFNIFLDRLCPFIFIISPTMIIYSLNPEKFLCLRNFLFIIVIHSFIIIPLIYFWALNRNWVILDNNKYFLDNPLLIFHIALGIVYPAFWGIFLSLNRFFYLNTTIDFLQYINFNILNILLPFLMPIIFYIQFYKSIFNFIKYCQQILWKSYCNICYVFHLFLLKYNFYFIICEYLYKYSFIFGNYIIMSPDIYPKTKTYSKWRYTLRYLYFKPHLMFYALFFEFFVELFIFKGKLYYGLFLIFIFVIGRMFVIFSLLFFKKDFIDDVCVVDYLNKKWISPRYPSYFWYNFEEHSILHQWSFDQEELKTIETQKKIYTTKVYKYRPTLITRVQGLGCIYRIKATYRTYTGVRWVHTGTAKPVHNLTALFMRSFLERGCFLNLPQGWQKYHNIIAYLDSKGYRTGPVPYDFYKNYQAPSSSLTSFKELIEHNLITNFVPLKKQNVVIKNYDNKMIINSKGQACPDAIFDLKNSTFEELRIIAMDQKSNPGEKGLANHILSNISEAAYIKGIRRYHSKLIFEDQNKKTLAINEIREGLELLVKTCNDITEHQLVWAKYLKYFPTNYMPPMRVPNNFCIEDLNKVFKEKIPHINEKIKRISDYLYKQKVPEIEYGTHSSLPKEALDLFNDSFLQKILSEI